MHSWKDKNLEKIKEVKRKPLEFEFDFNTNLCNSEYTRQV